VLGAGSANDKSFQEYVCVCAGVRQSCACAMRGTVECDVVEVPSQGQGRKAPAAGAAREGNRGRDSRQAKGRTWGTRVELAGSMAGLKEPLLGGKT
jgi:hypothetical protein